MSYHGHTIIEQLKTQSISYTNLIQKLQFMEKTWIILQVQCLC